MLASWAGMKEASGGNIISSRASCVKKSNSEFNKRREALANKIMNKYLQFSEGSFPQIFSLFIHCSSQWILPRSNSGFLGGLRS